MKNKNTKIVQLRELLEMCAKFAFENEIAFFATITEPLGERFQTEEFFCVGESFEESARVLAHHAAASSSLPEIIDLATKALEELNQKDEEKIKCLTH